MSRLPKGATRVWYHRRYDNGVLLYFNNSLTLNYTRNPDGVIDMWRPKWIEPSERERTLAYEYLLNNGLISKYKADDANV